MVGLGVLAHKGAAAFALSSSLLAAGVPHQRVRMMMGLFVLATPLSIVSMNWLSESVPVLTWTHLIWWLQAVAAGTFLYVATGHHLNWTQPASHACHTCRLRYVLRFGLGLLLMIGLSFLT